MRKVLLIGLDAASFNYLNPWIAAGELPNLAQLLENSSRGVLLSSIPPVTSVAWTSMVTGLNPGRLGFYDMVGRQDYSYEFIPATFLNTHRRAIWDILSKRGKRVAVIGVPSTYPASPVNGSMITGFDSPHEGTKLTYPPDLMSRLAQVGLSYPWKSLANLRLLEGQRKVGLKLNDYISHWRVITQAKAEITRWFLMRESPDFSMVVFSSTDHIVHHAREHQTVLQVYRHVDQAIGRILEVVDLKDTWVLVASDHGSTETDFFVALHRLLYDQGWISFKDEIASEILQWILRRVGSALEEPLVRLWQSLPYQLRQVLSWPLVRLDPRLRCSYSNIDWFDTLVYARNSHGPLYLNVHGREPQGIVKPGQPYEALRNEIISILTQVEDPATGNPLFGWVRRGEDVYQGPYVHPPPDIVFEPADWRYKFVMGLHTQELVRPNLHRKDRYVEHGWHTPWGIISLAGLDVQPKTIDQTRIVDVAPTILHLLEEPIPDDLDGEVIQEAIPQGWQIAHPIVKIPHTALPTETQGSPDKDDLHQVEERLRALGYLE